MEADPTDSVKELLEGAGSPMSTAQIAQALSEQYAEHEVAQSLDFWRREHHAAVQDEEGNWTWQGPGLS